MFSKLHMKSCIIVIDNSLPLRTANSKNLECLMILLLFRNFLFFYPKRTTDKINLGSKGNLCNILFSSIKSPKGIIIVYISGSYMVKKKST